MARCWQSTLPLLLAGLLSCATAARAEEAKIVLLTGEGEKTPWEKPEAWKAAALGDLISGGRWVRTLANSQMGITLPGRSQIRLNQNSMLQLKTASEAAAARQTRLNLARGRAWSQARPRSSAGAGTATPPLVMETPTTTLSIRGTDWEVEVAPDGSTQVVVLSGRVDVGNAQGSLSVGAGEAARAERGKAPVRLLLVDPRSRVQWVSSWEPRGERWAGAGAGRYPRELALIRAGDYSQALQLLLPRAARDVDAAVLAADLLIHDGRLQQAVELLAPHADEGRGEPRAAALGARALLRLDRSTEALALLRAARATRPGDAEVQLALGEAALLEGDAALARMAFGAVAEASDTGAGAPSPQQRAEAWLGLGRVSSERESLRAARRELNEALSIEPGLAAASAELATVDTLAGNLGAARTRYDALLATELANYVAFTGRGMNALIAGEPEAALGDFLAAGLIEPRYARGWLYQGVAFHQLGEAARSTQAFREAEALDPRDPLPHMMASQLAADALDYPRAIAEARTAQRKLPWLKSLDPLQNDQRGSANLGAPLAAAGLEEWARYNAELALTPYWGGSQLFLADRYTGLFNKNSSLMTGFLADPLAFGASNRSTTLVEAPGHYGRVDLEYQRDDYTAPGAALSLNGLVQSPLRGAYFLRGRADDIDARHEGTQGRQGALTAGIGLEPREDLGLFGFLVDETLHADLRNSSTPDANLLQSNRAGDLGLRWMPEPENQMWLKAGTRHQQSDRSGITPLPELAAVLQPYVLALNGVLPYLPGYVRDLPLPGDTGASDTGIDIEGSDLQLRHSFDAGGATWSWGLEDAEQEQSLQTRISLRPARSDNAEAFRVRTRNAWAGLSFEVSPSVQAALHAGATQTRSERSGSSESRLLPVYLPPDIALITAPTEERVSEDSTSAELRAGLSWQPADGQRLRLVAQRWQRPASFGSLVPTETLGIALNDRLPAPGGEYERLRLQVDTEAAEQLFLQVFADHERIDNGLAGERTAGFSYQIDALSQLRQNADFFSPREDIEETPIFPSGSVDTLGAAANWQAADRVTLGLRYLHRDSDNDQPGPDGRDWIPYIPEHFAQFRAQWNTPWRLLLSASALWRSERLERQLEVVGTDTVPLVDAGWSFGLRAYWESGDKHHSVQALVEDLAPERDAMSRNFRDPLWRFQYAYRF
jgi:predicted Zn-dependent protease